MTRASKGKPMEVYGDNTIQYGESEKYSNGFAQSISRQQLCKHVPACNNGRCVSVDEFYSQRATA
jgi:hypothetical protein